MNNIIKCNNCNSESIDYGYKDWQIFIMFMMIIPTLIGFSLLRKTFTCNECGNEWK